jgi:hypothetical protein
LEVENKPAKPVLQKRLKRVWGVLKIISLSPLSLSPLAKPSAASDLCENPRRTGSCLHAKVEENEHTAIA